VHLAYYKTYLHSHPEIALINSRLEPGMSPYAALAIIDATKSLFYALTSGIFAVVMSAGIKKLYDR
jgi:hypothetical protein